MKSVKVRVLSMVFFYCYAVSLWAAAASDHEYILFVGNPGVGKSTLINSIYGRNVAPSGLSAGVGMTKTFNSYEFNGRTYLDTPGLADAEIRAKAAVEIEKALKQNGRYRIFFVLTLEAGRIKPEDVIKIKTVMDAIRIKDAKFNIIINKVCGAEKRQVFNNSADFAELCGTI